MNAKAEKLEEKKRARSPSKSPESGGPPSTYDEDCRNYAVGGKREALLGSRVELTRDEVGASAKKWAQVEPLTDMKFTAPNYQFLSYYFALLAILFNPIFFFMPLMI